MTESKTPYNNNYFVSWDELHQRTKQMAMKMLDLSPWQGIIGVSRSGLIPATIVARELEVLMLDTICISSYDHQTQRDAQVLKGVNGDGAGWLVVDDLVDTGKTAQVIKAMLPKCHLATVFAKPKGIPYVDSFMHEVSQDTWIFFPWDVEPRFADPIITQRK